MGCPDSDGREIEHQMGNDRAENASQALDNDVRPDLPPRKLAAAGKNQGDGRIEMGARHGAKDGDDDDEDRAGRNGVAEQGDGLVPPAQPRRHDSRADDGRDQDAGAERFRQKAPPERVRAFAHQAADAGLPGSSLLFPIESS
jgi:hypothetical protein